MASRRQASFYRVDEHESSRANHPDECNSNMSDRPTRRDDNRDIHMLCNEEEEEEEDVDERENEGET